MRPIKTTYLDAGLGVLRVNSGTNANRAVAQCVMHMQVNHYGATVAEVYDDSDGKLHAQVRRDMDGSIHILYRRSAIAYHKRVAAAFLFKGIIK